LGCLLGIRSCSNRVEGRGRGKKAKWLKRKCPASRMRLVHLLSSPFLSLLVLSSCAPSVWGRLPKWQSKTSGTFSAHPVSGDKTPTSLLEGDSVGQARRGFTKDSFPSRRHDSDFPVFRVVMARLTSAEVVIRRGVSEMRNRGSESTKGAICIMPIGCIIGQSGQRLPCLAARTTGHPG